MAVLLKSMPAAELTEWIAFYGIEAKANKDAVDKIKKDSLSSQAQAKLSQPRRKRILR